jgi:hypothetical protein
MTQTFKGEHPVGSKMSTDLTAANHHLDRQEAINLLGSESSKGQ